MGKGRLIKNSQLSLRKLRLFIMPLAWRKKARKIFGTCLGLLALIWAKGMIDYEKK